jgi:hypothetical protein
MEESKDKDQYDDIGKEGHFLGFSPREWHQYIWENKKQPNPGNNDWNRSSINSDAARRGQGDPDAALAVVIAHEVGFHGIGGDWDYFSHPSTPAHDNVDSPMPYGNPGMNFTEPACKEICDELDIY